MTKLECQPLITAMKKHTKAITNLNTTIRFLREDLESLKNRRSPLYRVLNFLRGK